MSEDRNIRYAHSMAGYLGHIPEVDGPVPDIYFAAADEAVRVADAEQLELLDSIIRMIEQDFPDPNPLASIFSPYVGDEIVNRLKQMKEGK